MPLLVRPPGRFRFGEFRIDVQTGELSYNGHKSTLSEQPLQLLIALLEQPGELVTRDELRKRLWGFRNAY
jgi:DNA-binding winged helix-turn-helix (wHTH) protein